jgi:hypothetical protein
MIETLKRSWVALLVLGLALIAQIPHAAHVFDRAPYIGMAVQPTSAWYAWLLAYAYAIALESATLMFVVHGHIRASYGFALASFAVNLSYYAMHGVALFRVAALPVWLLSALLPIAIASYSHILAGAQDSAMQLPAWVARLRARLQPPLQPPAQEAAPLCTENATVQAGDEDMQPDPRTLARAMKGEGLSNAMIGAQLNVHPSTIGRWVNGSSKL